MAYSFVEPWVVDRQAIVSCSTTQRAPIGTEVKAKDPTLGEGTFKYLPGCTSAAVGIMVTWRESLSGVGSSAATANTANQGRPLAVAMGTIPSGTYGWFQVQGAAVIKKAAVAVTPSSKIYQSSTAGRLTGTAASGKQVLNAIATPTATVAAGTSTVVVQINRPFLQGQIL